MAGYDRQGGKANRRQQMERACAVCDWVQKHCQVHHLGQFGGRQVARFWISHKTLSDKTRYGYWLALVKLWEIAGKPGRPPAPFLSADNQSQIAREAT